MIRKTKKFSYPRMVFDKERIVSENKLLERYGLKNKKEVWKVDAKIKYFRDRAKKLITADREEQEVFFNKLKKIGLKVNDVGEVLGLDIEDLLKRRLVTVVWKKKLANTPKQARQLIVHKKITINGRVVNVPSYFVKTDEENKIEFKKKVKKGKVKEKGAEEEKSEEVVEVKDKVEQSSVKPLEEGVTSEEKENA
tara:strand:+ start:91 stop:675 length:585 start_codon:yes stop_codon:yes gene_type:complete